MRQASVLLIVVAVIVVGGPLAASAQVATFEVDPGATMLSISGNVQGATLLQQGPGSLSTTYTGPLNVRLSPSAIEFVGGSALKANDSGTWQPLPGGIAGSAPANYGARFILLFLPGNLAVRDAAFDVTSASPFPLAFGSANSGTFSSQVALTALDGTVDYNHPTAIGTSELAGGVGDNAASNPGTLSIVPDPAGGALASLVLPIDMTITDVAGSFTFRGTITAHASAGAGDANLDGTVNLADFNILAASFGAMSGGSWLSADFNFDGAVNLSDFNLLAASFGVSARGSEVTVEDWGALSSAVPEPSFFAATLVAGLALQRRRRANSST